MSLKRLMLATSVVALSLSGAAFAAGTSGSMQPSGSASGTSSTHESMSNSSMGAGVSHSDVTQAQTALKEKGLYSGPIDGRIGPKTRQAISQFQRQNGLKQTAQLDSRTMSELQGGGGTSGSGATAPSNASPSGSPEGSGAGGMPPAGGTGGMH
jgi:peptidoglycan hydrolase-like protein with peptidoglycan-binding domain